MRAIFPGRPQSKRQAVCTAHWDGLRVVAYISGNTAIILRDPENIIQTISIDHVESLVAITIDEESGRLALCDSTRLLIFNAVGREESDLRWTQAHDVAIPNGGIVHSLSWGNSEEILAGGTELWLYHVPHSDGPRLIWQQPVANEILTAQFSSNAELIASCGHHDKLVKIWRRISFELDSTRFDVSYLSHPSAVTNLHWRRPRHSEQNLDSLLYTISADNQVRVWSYSDPHSLSVLQLIASIDANSSIEPRRRSVGSLSRRRFVFILDFRDFSHATEKAIQQSHNRRVDHALEHLIEIANRSPELCVVFDGLGHMSVWGLENAGCKNQRPTIVFNVTLVDQVGVQLNTEYDGHTNYVQFCAFTGGSGPASLSLLVHSHTGQIDWYQSSISHFFDTAARPDRIKLRSSWSGHDLAIDHIVRSFANDDIFSWTDSGQAILWSQSHFGTLRRQCELDSKAEVLGAILLGASGFLVMLHASSISLWNVQYAHGNRVAEASWHRDETPTSIQSIVLQPGESHNYHLIINISDSAPELWQVHLPDTDGLRPKVNGTHSLLTKIEDLELVFDQGCRPVSMDSASHLHLPTAKGVGSEMIRVNADGKINCVRLRQDACRGHIEQTLMSSFVTNVISPALVHGVASGKCAMVARDKRHITIWDICYGTCEWQYTYDGTDEIQKLAWTSTSRGNLFLLIGLSYRALVVGQNQYRTTPTHTSAWCITQQINLRDFTTIHIGDICWLSSKDVVIAAGNQMFVLENVVTEHESLVFRESHHMVKSKSAEMVIDIANSSLPIFDARVLEALIIEDRLVDIEKILQMLYQKLRFFSEGDQISSDLGLPEVESLFLSATKVEQDATYMNGDMGVTHVELEKVVDSFTKYLDSCDIWQMGLTRRREVSSFLANLIKVRGQSKSLDANGLRYLYALYSTPVDRDLDWRAFVFASRSTSQEALVDLITQYYNGKLTWNAARRTGLFVWLEDTTSLQTQFENVARAEYNKHENRNPVDCSLYYLALNKKSVLQGLWRMTYGIKEKENTLKLLSNNFDDPRWRGTALKNAYALLSRRRFEYAAAFFLLAGSLKDAVNVCANQLKDIQLAISVARVWDRDVLQSQEVLTDLMTGQVLKLAVSRTDGRWMAAWAYLALNLYPKAIQAIVSPLHKTVDVDWEEHEEPLESMSFRLNDPHLHLLYVQIRKTLVDRNEWTNAVLSQQEEWDFVMRNAQWWSRAGIDYLALRLVRQWHFIPHQQQRPNVVPTTLTAAATEHAASTVSDVSDEKSAETAVVKKKPPPTQFIEPSMDSLLDNFGF